MSTDTTEPTLSLIEKQSSPERTIDTTTTDDVTASKSNAPLPPISVCIVDRSQQVGDDDQLIATANYHQQSLVVPPSFNQKLLYGNYYDDVGFDIGKAPPPPQLASAPTAEQIDNYYRNQVMIEQRSYTNLTSSRQQQQQVQMQSPNVFSGSYGQQQPLPYHPIESIHHQQQQYARYRYPSSDNYNRPQQHQPYPYYHQQPLVSYNNTPPPQQHRYQLSTTNYGNQQPPPPRYHPAAPYTTNWSPIPTIRPASCFLANNTPSSSSTNASLPSSPDNGLHSTSSSSDDHNNTSSSLFNPYPFAVMSSRQRHLSADVSSSMSATTSDSPSSIELKTETSDNTGTSVLSLSLAAAGATDAGGGRAARRTRRQRKLFSAQQTKELETIFTQNPYPDTFTREQLAKRSGVSTERIQIWFQNRRSKWRRIEKTYGEMPPKAQYGLYGAITKHSVKLPSIDPHSTTSPFTGNNLFYSSSHDNNSMHQFSHLQQQLLNTNNNWQLLQQQQQQSTTPRSTVDSTKPASDIGEDSNQSSCASSDTPSGRLTSFE